MAAPRPIIFHYPSIDSTNDEAVRLLKVHTPTYFVVADAQTKGRGRQGRSWHSPEGNLYCTATFSATLPLGKLPLFTLYAALKLCHALTKRTKLKLWLKWPNDLWIGTKKCAGLLAEAPVTPQGGRALLLGVGLNVNTQKFPAELKGRATSLSLAAHKVWDKDALLKIEAAALAEAYERYTTGRYEKELYTLWARYDKLTGRTISFEENGTVYKGKVLGISHEGALCVKVGKVIHTLRSGEVTLSKFL